MERMCDEKDKQIGIEYKTNNNEHRRLKGYYKAQAICLAYNSYVAHIYRKMKLGLHMNIWAKTHERHHAKAACLNAQVPKCLCEQSLIVLSASLNLHCLFELQVRSFEHIMTDSFFGSRDT